MLLRQKGQPRTAEEVFADFGVTPALGRAYADAAGFFSTLRDVRDRIVHGGKALDMIFVTDKGFCWHRDFPALSGAGAEPIEHHYNAHLVSLIPVVAQLRVWVDRRL